MRYENPEEGNDNREEMQIEMLNTTNEFPGLIFQIILVGSNFKK